MIKVIAAILMVFISGLLIEPSWSWHELVAIPMFAVVTYLIVFSEFDE